MSRQYIMNRRSFLRTAAGSYAYAWLSSTGYAGTPPLLTKTIPSSGEPLPVIGMGSWITFNVGNDTRARDARAEVLRAFFAAGGGLIDSSPMYGSAQAVIGHGLGMLGKPDGLFAATKVWTSSTAKGVTQVENAEKLWDIDAFSLMQIHNLVNWESHLETLLEMKASGRIRYVGVTTSHGRRHGELEKIMASQPIDFVQLTYNLRDRGAEKRLLPLARERKLAVIANRPFRRGELFKSFGDKPLPPWAGEMGCRHWAQFMLKFIVSHPAITCAIPATSQVEHMHQNMAAPAGRLPDARGRRRMAEHFNSL